MESFHEKYMPVVDWVIRDWALKPDVYRKWREKIGNDDHEDMDRWKGSLLEDGDSVGGICEIRVFVACLRHLSQAKAECRDTEPYFLSVSNKIWDWEEGDTIEEGPAFNTRLFRDPHDSGIIMGLDTESAWVVGHKGIACLESELEGERIHNPLKAAKRAMTYALGERGADRAFLKFAGEIFGESDRAEKTAKAGQKP